MSMSERNIEDMMNTCVRGIEKSKKFIFVHIPKTAGHSIRSLYNTKYTTHVPCSWYRKYDPDTKHYYKFTVIRNPWERLVSLYHHYNTRVHYPNSKLFKLYSNFEEFVTDLPNVKILTIEETIKYSHDRVFLNNPNAEKVLSYNFQPQVYWIDDDINQIIRLENLNEDTKLLCQKINIKHKAAPHLNKSNHLNYRKCYNESTKKIVEKIYAQDISKFGYTF